MYHPLARLDQYTRVTLNAITWNSELKWPNELEGQGQWPPFSIPAERISRCIFLSNLVIVTEIHYMLLCEQAKFPKILSQNGQNDLEAQGQWPQFSIPAVNFPGCMFCANLVIPTQIFDDLSCGQGKAYGQTDRRPDTGNDNTRRPERSKGKNANFIHIYVCMMGAVVMELSLLSRIKYLID